MSSRICLSITGAFEDCLLCIALARAGAAFGFLREAELRRLRQSPENRRHLLDILVAKLKGHRGLPD